MLGAGLSAWGWTGTREGTNGRTASLGPLFQNMFGTRVPNVDSRSQVSPCHNLVLIDRENEKVKYVWNDMHASFFVKVQEKEDQNKKPIPTQDAILSSLLWAQRLSLSLKIFLPIDSILFFIKSGKLDSWFLYSPVEGSETFWPASACKRLGSISSFFSKVR